MLFETDPKFVMMPIPVEALPEVHELLLRFHRGGTVAESPLREEPLPTDERATVRNSNGNSTWTPAEIRELYRKFRSPVGRAVIRHVAHAQGGPVLYGDMAAAADLEVDQLRAQLAWFSKYAKQIKGGEPHWPLQVQDDPTKPKGERYTYTMPRSIALWWLQADTENQATYDPMTDEYTPLCKSCEKKVVAVAHGGHVCTNEACDMRFLPQKVFGEDE
jgi:hypothetical protein